MPADPAAAADFALLQHFWNDPVYRRVLPNGLTVLVKPDHRSPVASVQVWVKTGSLHEGRALGAGLSHYLEHMLFKGTTRRTGRDISTEVQAHGGYINAYTTFDRTVYYIDLPAEHVGVAVDVLADMVLHSTLDPTETKREKGVIVREIAMGDDDPDQRLGQAMFSTAFRQHPYGHPIIGHRDVFSGVTRRELLDYYRERYVPNNLVVVVAGALQPETVMAGVEQHFGNAPRRALPPVFVPQEPGQLAPRACHEFAEVELSRAGVAWPIPGLTHPDAPALDVVALILGSGDSSILWQSIREKAGLVHSIDASSWNPGSSGLFSIYLSCDATKRAAAESAVNAEIARLQRVGFTAAQLRKAIRQLVVAEINSRRTVSGQASRLGVAEVVVGDLDFSRTYFQRLAALRPADLRRVLRDYLVPATTISVSLNPLVKDAVAAPASPAISAADYLEHRLPNGARLLLRRDSSLPNVHFRLCALAGARYEPADRRGATSLLANLLTKDTQRRTAAGVAQAIESVGGSFQPMSGNNTLGMALEVLPSDVALGFELLGDAVHRPAFRRTTLQHERDAQLAVLQDDNDNVVSHGLKLLRKRFFGAHPLAVGPHGEEASVAQITTRDLAALHRRLLVAGNVVLVIVGDFDLAQAEKAGRKLLGSLPRGNPQPLGPTFAAPMKATATIERQPRRQAVVFEAYPGPAMGAEDFFVSEVMDELFSGMSSRLFERVRDELGLAYYVRSARVIGLDASMFYFYAGSEPGKEAAVLKEITAEIRRVGRGGVSAEELRRCQVRLKAAHRMGLQTNSSRAMQAALNVLYGRPADDTADYDQRIDAVTGADLAAFVKRYFRAAGRTRLTIRP